MAELLHFPAVKSLKTETGRARRQADQKAIRNTASDIQILANTLIDNSVLLGDEHASAVIERLQPLRDQLREIEDFVVAMTNPPKGVA